MAITGRPTKKTPDVIGKLESAFANGYNIVQACSYANIHPDTYYEWLNNDQDFSDNMTKAQTNLGMHARKVVADEVKQGNLRAATWWLERRDPEFKDKSSVELAPTDSKVEERLAGLLDGRTDDIQNNSQPTDATS